MALDATVGGAAAESYLSVADADALAADDYGPEREWWLDQGLEEKELALKRATDEIDDWVRSGWARYATAQALAFPRLIDVADYPVAPFLPERLRRATYYQAAFLVRNARVLAAADTRRARGLQSASEPNMSYTPASEPETLSRRAQRSLEGYRKAGGSKGVRTVRMGSGYLG